MKLGQRPDKYCKREIPTSSHINQIVCAIIRLFNVFLPHDHTGNTSADDKGLQIPNAGLTGGITDDRLNTIVTPNKVDGATIDFDDHKVEDDDLDMATFQAAGWGLIPQNAIIMIDGSEAYCPSGFTDVKDAGPPYSLMEGRMIKGSSAFSTDVAGLGRESHNHTVGTHDHNINNGSHDHSHHHTHSMWSSHETLATGLSNGDSSSGNYNSETHWHEEFHSNSKTPLTGGPITPTSGNNTSGSTASSTIFPAYEGVKFCKKD